MDKGKPLYQVDARKKGTLGKRESFLSLADAEARAKEIATSLQMEGLEGMAIRPELRIMALQAERELAEYGKKINDAVCYYVQHLKNLAIREKSLTVEKLVEKWTTAKTENKNKPLRDKTKEGIEEIGNILKRAFGNIRIADVTKDQIDKYLQDTYTGNVRRDNVRRGIAAFYNWTIANGFYTENPAKQIEITIEQRDLVEILKVEKAREIFDKLQSPEFQELIPYFAVCCFAGLRPTEAEKLTWEMIDLQHRQITVLASTSKVKDSRNVEIEKTLMEWLKSWTGEKKGLIVNPVNLRKRLTKFRIAVGYKYKKLGLDEYFNPQGQEWVEDVMRHSYGSYYLSVKKDYGHVAMQMGNSIPVVKKHYKRLVTKEQAAGYWNILPKSPKDQMKDLKNS